MSTELARQVADAVLFEGYVLYPYRASAQKNQTRWQFGVLAPRGGDEASDTQTECLVEAGEYSELTIVLRFLQVQTRSGEVPWDEGVVREVPVRLLLDSAACGEVVHPFHFDGGTDVEGATVRQRWPLHGSIAILATPLQGPYGLVKLRVRVTNESTCDTGSSQRPELLRHCLVAAHSLLSVTDGSFVSMLEPPEWAAPAVAGCVNERTWPVLVGTGRSDVLLSSPIILYDYPEIAPESVGDMCDATEMDEMLVLRTLTLTDAEKAEARATDPRSAAIIDQVDGMPPELLDKLHGAIRYLRKAGEPVHAADPVGTVFSPETGLPTGGVPSVAELAAHFPAVTDLDGGLPNPADLIGAGAQDGGPLSGVAGAAPWWNPGADRSVSPETDRVAVPGGEAARGSRVRLHPREQGTDAQDMFLRDRIATVQAVVSDVDGFTHLAVTVDDDPAADLHSWYGRYLYFLPTEVELVSADSELSVPTDLVGERS